MAKIPHNSAIRILEERLSDLHRSDIDLKALKNRLISDVERIFGRASTQHITAIGLETPFSMDKASRQIKTFEQTIQGWIDFIKDFHLIDQEKVEISERECKERYSDLSEKWNNLVTDYNNLIKSNENTVMKYDKSLAEIRMLEEKLSQNQTVGEIIKILFLSASPADEDRLRLDAEFREIEERLRLAKLRDQFDLTSKWAITPTILQQSMLDVHPTIVHFSGHGDIDGIAVEDTVGNSKLIDNEALGSLFELFSKDIKCVILNSCYSESQADEISKYVPYVIGMKNSVDDQAAKAFSIGFYMALGAGTDIPFAFKMGVLGISLGGHPDKDIPILLG